jgi:hypothetical protein
MPAAQRTRSSKAKVRRPAAAPAQGKTRLRRPAGTAAPAKRASQAAVRGLVVSVVAVLLWLPGFVVLRPARDGLLGSSGWLSNAAGLVFLVALPLAVTGLALSILALIRCRRTRASRWWVALIGALLPLPVLASWGYLLSYLLLYGA